MCNWVTMLYSKKKNVLRKLKKFKKRESIYKSPLPGPAHLEQQNPGFRAEFRFTHQALKSKYTQRVWILNALYVVWEEGAEGRKDWLGAGHTETKEPMFQWRFVDSFTMKKVKALGQHGPKI